MRWKFWRGQVLFWVWRISGGQVFVLREVDSAETTITRASSSGPLTNAATIHMASCQRDSQLARPSSTSFATGSSVYSCSSWTTARRTSCRAGRRGMAVDRAQPDGNKFEKHRRRPGRGRPYLVGRAMALSDDADAVFFRAVARDRHPTQACPASRTRRGMKSAWQVRHNS